VTPQVTGRVVIAASVPRFSAGILRVRLEDVSYADARATVLAQIELPGIAHDPSALTDAETGTVVSFSLTPSRDIEPDHDYSVRASLERGGDRESGRDQWQSDRSYPVLTRGFGSDVTVTIVA
jgi:uncharacterized lipoprotein YbaY